MRPEKNKFWKTMKTDCFFIANENQMEFGLLKIKSELSGKNGTHEKFIFLGMTEVIVVGETKACRLKE
jgi:lysyl-tRNA synthetase class 2